MLQQESIRIGAQLAEQLREHVVSILYYPHPFGAGGFVVVFENDRGDLLDLIARAFGCVPPGTHLSCVRHSELRELSLPIHSWLDPTNRHIHVPFWLRHKGAVLYGRDVRGDVPLPDAKVLLDVHVEVTVHYMRGHIILGKCVRGDYAGLIRRLDSQMRYLMATALLAHDEWDVSPESVPGLFYARSDDAEMLRLWDEFGVLARGAEAEGVSVSRESAFEAVWLFESWIRRLRATL